MASPGSEEGLNQCRLKSTQEQSCAFCLSPTASQALPSSSCKANITALEVCLPDWGRYKMGPMPIPPTSPGNQIRVVAKFSRAKMGPQNCGDKEWVGKPRQLQIHFCQQPGGKADVQLTARAECGTVQYAFPLYLMPGKTLVGREVGARGRTPANDTENRLHPLASFPA